MRCSVLSSAKTLYSRYKGLEVTGRFRVPNFTFAGVPLVLLLTRSFRGRPRSQCAHPNLTDPRRSLQPSSKRRDFGPDPADCHGAGARTIADVAAPPHPQPAWPSQGPARWPPRLPRPRSRAAPRSSGRPAGPAGPTVEAPPLRRGAADTKRRVTHACAGSGVARRAQAGRPAAAPRSGPHHPRVAKVAL